MHGVGLNCIFPLSTHLMYSQTMQSDLHFGFGNSISFRADIQICLQIIIM